MSIRKVPISFLVGFLLCLRVMGQGPSLDMPLQNEYQEVVLLESVLSIDSNYLILPFDRYDPGSLSLLENILTQLSIWRDNYALSILVIDVSQPYSWEKSKACFDLISANPTWFVSSDDSLNQELAMYSLFLLPVDDRQTINVFGHSSCIEIERLLLEHFLKPPTTLLSQVTWSQTIKNKHCQSWGVQSVDYESTTVIDGEVYILSKGRSIREDSLFGNLYMRFNNEDLIYMDYTSPVCSYNTIMDFEGDEMTYQVVSIEEHDGRKHLFTDQKILGPCGEETPWVLIQGLGSNGGLFIDIEQQSIRTRLICHTTNEEEVFADDDYIHLCGSSSIVDLESTFLNIAPNPTGGSLTITASNAFSFYQVINLDGKILSSAQFANTSDIDLSSYPNGIYFLRLLDSQLQAITSKTVIKQGN